MGSADKLCRQENIFPFCFVADAGLNLHIRTGTFGTSCIWITVQQILLSFFYLRSVFDSKKIRDVG